MKYFKNTELAELYHVSEKSVRNWIEATENGKLPIQLFEDKGKKYIANTSKNAAIIENQVQKGQKFINQRGHKTIIPSDEFYKIYSDAQILDIISSFTIHRESPLQYTYVDGGANDWNDYAKRLYSEQTPNILNSTLKMLAATTDTIDHLLECYEKINVVDLGPGNGLPIRSTLERLIKDGRLNRYIPIDISQDMISILQKNMNEWFGDSVTLEPHLLDISYERFNDFLASDPSNVKIANLVFLMGGTLANFRSPSQILRVINNSMGLDDVLIYSGYLDTPKTRRYFDYYNSSERKVPIQDGTILELLNIDDSLYDVEQSFDEIKRARTINVLPKVDLTIKFELKSGTKYVHLIKGEPILIWRHRHKSITETIDLFDENGFDLMQATKSPNQEYVLISAKVKVGVELS